MCIHWLPPTWRSFRVKKVIIPNFSPNNLFGRFLWKTTNINYIRNVAVSVRRKYEGKHYLKIIVENILAADSG